LLVGVSYVKSTIFDNLDNNQTQTCSEDGISYKFNTRDTHHRVNELSPPLKYSDELLDPFNIHEDCPFDF
jgi:hypothetical protein